MYVSTVPVSLLTLSFFESNAANWDYRKTSNTSRGHEVLVEADDDSDTD